MYDFQGKEPVNPAAVAFELNRLIKDHFYPEENIEVKNTETQLALELFSQLVDASNGEESLDCLEFGNCCLWS